MALKPLNPEHMQTACQMVLAYLDDPANSTPNDMLEGIVSGKSILRGVLSGNLVICQNVPDEPKPKEVPKPKADVDVDVEIEEEDEPTPVDEAA